MLWLSVVLALAQEDPPLSARALQKHLAHLASDAMEGRAPGSRGGEAAAEYIAAAFGRAGLDPLPAGGYFQNVPLVGRLAIGDDTLALNARAIPKEAYAVTSARDVTAELVLAGHGGPDDYADVDVRGKIVAVLPGVPQGEDRDGYAAQERYKLETVREKGALGLLFLFDADAEKEIAGWRGELSREQVEEGWLTSEPLSLVGALDAAVLPRDKEKIEITVRGRERVRRFSAPNVVGVLPGGCADAVVLTAHYDAYGVGPADEEGDSIYNGALDNAAGTAALIELARHFGREEERLDRTLVFIATTAEEHGALGTRYYAENPVVPLDETVVVLNLDGINMIAPTDDFSVFPSEGTETEASLEIVGERMGMRLGGEAWQRGMHFAFDTAPFLERGIVGLTLWQGSAHRGVTQEEASARRRRFGRIHTPNDEWPGSADEAAIEQHLRLYLAAIEHFGGDTPRPTLSPGHPFGRND